MIIRSTTLVEEEVSLEVLILGNLSDFILCDSVASGDASVVRIRPRPPLLSSCIATRTTAIYGYFLFRS